MKVTFQGQTVTLDDELGNLITMTTDQMVEMIRILNLTLCQDGDIIFKSLEFTV